MKLKYAPLRYYGGKWKIAPWIISHFPEHDSYIEPFAGGAGVLLSKQPSFIEVYNDINLNVVNFFKVLRDRPDDLVRVLELSPYSRYEYSHTKDGYEDCDDLEKARRFYVSSCQGRGRGGKLEDGGWQFNCRRVRTYSTLVSYQKMIDGLLDVACRLRDVHIEYDDALAVIARYDDPKALFYVDPPYMPDTRCMRWRSDGYLHELDAEMHKQLLDTLLAVKGAVVLSGYDSTLYNDALKGWQRYEKSSVKGNGTRSTEVLWANRRTQLRLLG